MHHESPSEREPRRRRALGAENLEIDVRDVLPSIRVPTLVLHRRKTTLPIEGARWMAERIPVRALVELPGGPH